MRNNPPAMRPTMRIYNRQRTRTRQRFSIVEVSSIVAALMFMVLFAFNLGDVKSVRAAANGDYRSIATGNWNSASTWEKYNGTSWAAASAAPTSADGVITIQTGHIVTVTANVTVDQVVVDAGGEMDLNSTIALTISNGTGTDVDVTGIFKNTGIVTLTASATMVYENGGKYQHNFTNVGGTIPAATWSTGSTCEIIGYTSNTSAPSGLQSFYNFTWNCPSQTGAINLGGGLTTINGNFNLISTGTGDLRFASSGVTVNISGDMNITGGSLILSPSNGQNPILNLSGNYSQSSGIFSPTIGNNRTASLNVTGNWSHTGGILSVGGNGSTNCQVAFNKSGTQTFTASANTVSAAVDFTVNSGSTLDMGTSVLKGRNFTLSSGAGIIIGSLQGITTSGATGNIQVTNTRTYSTGANYTLAGGSGQVSGNAFPASLNNMTVNNSSGITMSSTISVTGTLTFITGKVTTGSSELKVTNTSPTAITGYSSSNYVIGNLRRSVSASGSYDFPVGNSSNYELINVTFSGMTGISDLLAAFVNSNPINIALPLTNVLTNGTEITDMLDYGYWTMTPNSPMAGGTYTVTVYEKGHGNSASDALSYCVLKRANALSSWQSLGTHNNNTQSENGGTAIASRSALTGFSHFGIGKGGGVLPIQLVYFDAKPAGNSVICSWRTLTEINNDYFTIERSADGRTFAPVGTKDGAGNSNAVLNYSFEDKEAPPTVLYYRLKQTDFDGQFTYSKIKSVVFKPENMADVITIGSISPNPFKSDFSVTYSVLNNADVTVSLMNASGQEVYHEQQNAMKGTNRFDYNDADNMPTGIYFVRISFDKNVSVKKIVKN